jgi:hypothetical protein
MILLATSVPVAFATASGGVSWTRTLVALDEPAGAETAVARFAFENTSAHPIEIVGIRTSCDCTAAIAAKSVYLPGEKGEITATMTIGDRTGRQDKTISVTTSDAGGRKFVHTLLMRVQIPELVSCSTQLLTWSVGEPPVERTVDLSIAPSVTMARVSLASIEPAQAEAQLEQRSPTDYRLRLRPKSTARAGTFMVKLSVDAGSHGARSVEVFALVR